MPAQHITKETWVKVEKETVKAVIHTRSHLRPTEILDMLIKKGLKTVSEEDYEKLAKEKGR